MLAVMFYISISSNSAGPSQTFIYFEDFGEIGDCDSWRIETPVFIAICVSAEMKDDHNIPVYCRHIRF